MRMTKIMFRLFKGKKILKNFQKDHTFTNYQGANDMADSDYSFEIMNLFKETFKFLLFFTLL